MIAGPAQRQGFASGQDQPAAPTLPFHRDDPHQPREDHALDSSDICIIMNAGAGKQEAGTGPDGVKAAFAALGASCTVKLIEDGTQIEAETRKLRDAGFKTIVAGGGDGTICAVASALRGSDVVMGILPLGTFNYFARSLDLPMEVEAAAKVIVEGRTRPLRIAEINDRVFLNNASLGAYPAILEVREGIYKRWGRSQIAAYWAVIKTLSTVRAPLRLRITADGETRDVHSPLVFVVNNAYQLKEMAVEGAELIEEGKLVVFIAPDCSRFEMLRSAVKIGLGGGLPDRKFEVLSGRQITIEGTGRLGNRQRYIARDGERERMASPFKMEVIEDALTVIVPESAADRPR